MGQRRHFHIPTGSIFRKEQSYELEKNRPSWLHGSVCFRSLACDGADERRTRWDGNARRWHGNARWWHGDARRFHAAFDGTDANAWRFDDEFTLAPPTVWQSSLRRS